jgi:hypothetical protein
MPHRSVEARWRELESDAHLPEVQEIIREEIQNGTIRVGPTPGGGICIEPIEIPDTVELREVQLLPTQSLGQTNPLRRAVRRHQLVRR